MPGSRAGLSGNLQRLLLLDVVIEFLLVPIDVLGGQFPLVCDTHHAHLVHVGNRDGADTGGGA